MEADRIADSVMGRDGGGKSSLDSMTSAGGESLRRSEADEAPAESEGPAQGQGTAEDVAAMLLDEDDAEDGGGEPASDSGHLQARERAGETPTIAPHQAARIEMLRGNGQALAPSHRAFFEPRLGRDLSQVRVHTGAEAAGLAEDVRARAFTVGRDIVFGERQFQPESAGGRWLIAHELAHVMQQSEGSPRSAAGQNVRQSGRRVQGGFFSNVWSGIKKGASAVAGGIKKGASAVWSGIKKGASAVWRGTKWAAGKVWSGVKAVAGWGWNVIKSGAALVWRQIVSTPGRIWRVIKHLGSGVAGVASWLWEGLKLAWHLDFKGMGHWLLDGILSGAAWVLKLFAKLIDVAGIGEVWDLLFQIIKFNTRALSSEEKTEAEKTFKSSIAYWQVRVDDRSLIAAIGAAFKGGGGMGVTTFHTINFNQRVSGTAGGDDMHWLTHELTHVSQYEHAGAQYLGEAIHAQSTGGYDYLGPNALWRPTGHVSANPSGKHFSQFNREQQGDIAADYYFSLYSKQVRSDSFGFFTPVQSDYEPVIDELRAGKL
jgi:hypothetical protein